jgi:hypothetical protein
MQHKPLHESGGQRTFVIVLETGEEIVASLPLLYFDLAEEGLPEDFGPRAGRCLSNSGTSSQERAIATAVSIPRRR